MTIRDDELFAMFAAPRAPQRMMHLLPSDEIAIIGAYLDSEDEGGGPDPSPLGPLNALPKSWLSSSYLLQILMSAFTRGRYPFPIPRDGPPRHHSSDVPEGR